MPTPIVTKEEIFRRMDQHVVSVEDQARITQLRTSMIGLANIANDIVPAGREGSLMMTKLEEALMWGVKAIAAK